MFLVKISWDLWPVRFYRSLYFSENCNRQWHIPDILSLSRFYGGALLLLCLLYFAPVGLVLAGLNSAIFFWNRDFTRGQFVQPYLNDGKDMRDCLKPVCSPPKCARLQLCWTSGSCFTRLRPWWNPRKSLTSQRRAALWTGPPHPRAWRWEEAR